VVTLSFPAMDFGRTHFAVSPMWETVASLRTARTARPGSLHERWAREVRTSVADGSAAHLLALVPATGHLADFLTPVPTRRATSFADELAHVAATDGASVVADLDHLLAANPPAAARRLLEEGRDDVDRFCRSVAEELDQHWQRHVRPRWERLRSVAEADITWRLEQVAGSGVRGVLENLHPRVRLAGDTLTVDTSCAGDEAVVSGHDLVLVPCAFTWPEVLCLTAPGRTPTLSYAPRGAGRLWGGSTPPDRALAELLGRTRADTLLRLEIPMTTSQLADALAVAAPTMSAHLQILRRAGVVSATRRGRRVYYARTSLGEHLAGAGAPAS
jgi:DNA-binding transcriptional ArsR family regulator